MTFGNMDLFQAGSLFPSVSGSALFIMNGNDVQKLEIDCLKKQIIQILNKEDNVNISSLSEKLNSPPRKIVLAINQLKEDGIIKEI